MITDDHYTNGMLHLLLVYQRLFQAKKVNLLLSAHFFYLQCTRVTEDGDSNGDTDQHVVLSVTREGDSNGVNMEPPVTRQSDSNGLQSNMEPPVNIAVKLPERLKQRNPRQVCLSVCSSVSCNMDSNCFDMLCLHSNWKSHTHQVGILSYRGEIRDDR